MNTIRRIWLFARIVYRISDQEFAALCEIGRAHRDEVF